MLDTLSKATDINSPEYASILVFLRKRLAQRDNVLFQKDIHPPHSKNPPKPSSGPSPDSTPLLVNTTPAPTRENPNPRPTYAAVARPRPLSELPPGKKRKIPKFDMARDYPILRFDKPQPSILNRVLTQKNATRTKRLDLVRDWNDDDTTIINMADCVEEDHWEDLLIEALDDEFIKPVLRSRSRGKKHELLVEREGQERFLRALDETEAWLVEHNQSNRHDATYKRALEVYGVDWVFNTLTRDREDAVARANTMRRIIAEEKELAAMEKKQNQAQRKAKWEAGMFLEYGTHWQEMVALEKTLRIDDRKSWLTKTKEEREAVSAKLRQDWKAKHESQTGKDEREPLEREAIN